MCACVPVCVGREFAKDWDGVEMTLHFTTLLAARLTWDLKVKKVLQLIKKRGVCMHGWMAGRGAWMDGWMDGI